MDYICLKLHYYFIKANTIHNFSGLYSKHVTIVPVLVESWSGQVNSVPL